MNIKNPRSEMKGMQKKKKKQTKKNKKKKKKKKKKQQQQQKKKKTTTNKQTNWVLGVDKKKTSLSITASASIVMSDSHPRDGFFYLPLTPMIQCTSLYSFLCHYGESGFRLNNGFFLNLFKKISD